MKVAICLSGIFDDVKNVKLLKIIFNNFSKRNNIEIDFFIHTWSIKDTVEIIKTFLPKKYCVESINIYNNRPRIVNEEAIKYDQTAVVNHEASKLYSSMRVGELKLDYEIENNFYYDACIKIDFNSNYDRNDIITFLENNLLNNKVNFSTIYPIYFSNMKEFPFEFVDYSIFLSDSQTFNILSSFYKFLPIINENIFKNDVKLEEVFAYYIRMFRLNIDFKK